MKRALRAGGIAIENPRRYFDTPRAAMPSVHADPNAVKASRDDPDNVEKRFKAMPIPARYKVRHGGRWGTSKDRAVGPDKRPPTVSLASMVASITKQEDEKYVPAQPIGPMIEIANKARMKRVREFYDRKFSGGLARLPVSALWNHLLNANRIEVEKFVISLVLCERNDAATGKRVRVLSQLEAQCKACDTAWIARKEGSDAGHEVKDATVLTCPSCKAEEIVEAALLRWAMEAIETVVLRERPQCS